MNAVRRKMLKTALEVISECLSDEQNAFDNMPESFQEGERGDTMQENITNLEDAENALQEIMERGGK